MAEKNGTVLIIDDSPASARQLFESLGDECNVLVATRGAEGIEVAAAQCPDLILLDVVMPELNGYEVCARLKDNPRTRDIPIIFITARDDEEDEERGLSLGAIDYLTKPLRPAIVRARVKNHIELKRSRDLLQRLTTLDPLTGIANRRHFDAHLAAEWVRATREGSFLSLAMIDVDHFKRYNDHYGHALGDRCLGTVAVTLQAALQRPADLVARYGGEEFVCVLPDTDLAGAEQIAKRICSAVEALAIAHADSPVAGHVTISLGIATVLPRPELPPTGLIEAADRALYEAKQRGRNRVCCSAGVSGHASANHSPGATHAI